MNAENKSIVMVDESKTEKKMFRSRKIGSMKRKGTIFKKTMELSKLCDVEACTVVVDTDGEVSTWPENLNEVLKTIKNFRRRRDNENKKKKTPPQLKEFDEDEKLFAGISMEDIHRFLEDDGGNNDEPRNLVEEVELKIYSLTERIEFLKYEKEDNQKNPSSSLFSEIGCLLKSVPEQLVPTPCFLASNPQCIEMVPSSCFFDSNQLYFHGRSDPASGFYGLNNLPGMAAPTSGFNQEESISETNPNSLGGGVTQQFNSANFLDFDFLNFDHF